MFGSAMNLITTIIGFGISATFIVFVCTRLICGRLRRFEDRQMFEIDTRIDLELPEHQINGLQPLVVDAIPTMRFTREAFSYVEDAQCSICLAEYEEEEVLRIMPKCGHNFHLSCIDTWLMKQSTCPVCRISVQEFVESKHTLTAAQSFDGSDSGITLEQGMVPAAALADEASDTNRTQADLISIELELANSTSRPSS